MADTLQENTQPYTAKECGITISCMVDSWAGVAGMLEEVYWNLGHQHSTHQQNAVQSILTTGSDYSDEKGLEFKGRKN